MNQGKIVVNFTVKTKMANPEFRLRDVHRAVKDKINQGLESQRIDSEKIIRFPAKVVSGTIKSFEEVSKAMINGTFGIARELERRLADVFRH